MLRGSNVNSYLVCSTVFVICVLVFEYNYPFLSPQRRLRLPYAIGHAGLANIGNTHKSDIADDR